MPTRPGTQTRGKAHSKKLFVRKEEREGGRVLRVGLGDANRDNLCTEHFYLIASLRSFGNHTRAATLSLT